MSVRESIPSDPSSLPEDAPLVAVLRGGLPESVHRGRYAVVSPAGETLDEVGEAEGFTWLRSSAKPFQALALFVSGTADALGLSDEEVAVACGSHSGEPRHLAAVRSLLRKAGLSEADLQNGTHPPMHAPSAARLARSGEEPRPVHGNCSGKHAGFLAVSAHAGWETASYRDPDGPLQRIVRSTVAEACGLAGPDELRLAGDGCGVPVLGMPLRNLALGFARLAAGGAETGLPDGLVAGLRRVRDAMRAYPLLVAGTGRFDTRLMEAGADLGIVAKGGAEGVFGCGVPEGDGRGAIGLALKISDGAGRAVAPAAVAALVRAGIPVPEELGRREVKDLHGKVVGEVISVP
jgi:L-asparaginase II